jgi:ribosome maturation factor RimP
MVSKENIESAVNEWIGSNDAFLVEVKTSPSRIAVFIDKPEGITLQECAALNRYLAGRFENDPVWETHELEVSSPGMDQPLRVYKQYLRRLGREVRLVLQTGKVVKGKLIAADETGIEVAETVSNRERKNAGPTRVNRRFAYDELKETKLVISFKN